MMIETRDPAIKLFGMKIPFPEVMDLSGGDDKVNPEQETPDLSEKKKICNNNLNNSNDTKSESGDKEELESSESPENTQQTPDGKILKKPTKILPCPRCKSMETKFCYYNNYNVNQPRHFCRACQRYWTAGGTMRNVPVGAGRRKNKSSASPYRHITIAEALEAARIDPSLHVNTKVLSFGHHKQHTAPVTPVAVMKLQGDHKVARNGFHGVPEQAHVVRVENGDDCSNGSSVTTSNNHTDESRPQSCVVSEPQTNNINGYACIPGVPWPYIWNPSMPPSAFYPPPPYPVPFYPYWTIPMLPPNQSSTPNSHTLGKHSRDEPSGRTDIETDPKQRNNGCVLIPKTLRIDDPNEAAKSSIWTTLGIKNEGLNKNGMFKGFDLKTKKNNTDKSEKSSLLSANPAALSRSRNFHEQI